MLERVNREANFLDSPESSQTMLFREGVEISRKSGGRKRGKIMGDSDVLFKACFCVCHFLREGIVDFRGDHGRTREIPFRNGGKKMGIKNDVLREM